MTEQEFVEMYKNELSELKECFPNLKHTVDIRSERGETIMELVSLEPYNEDDYTIFEAVCYDPKKYEEAIQDHIKAIEKHYKYQEIIEKYTVELDRVFPSYENSVSVSERDGERVLVFGSKNPALDEGHVAFLSTPVIEYHDEILRSVVRHIEETVEDTKIGEL